MIHFDMRISQGIILGMNDTFEKKKIRVGVLRGGPSPEYDVSLDTGLQVLQNLPDEFVGQDIYISRDGDWHMQGFIRPPERILSNVDVVFNALHGAYGEDGKVQSVLDRFQVPYTGSEVLPSSFGMNKGMAKKFFQESGIKTPYSVVITPKDATAKRVVELFQTFPHPTIIKPVSGGSSLGITVADNFLSFELGIEDAFRRSGAALLEEYIYGREASCTVLENSDGTISALFPIEISRNQAKKFYDFESKTSLDCEHICPSSFESDIKSSLQNTAIRAHQSLGLRHYSQSDFIVSPKRGIFLLEVNSQPGLTRSSLLPRSLAAAGISLRDFIHHIVTLVLPKS